MTLKTTAATRIRRTTAAVTAGLLSKAMSVKARVSRMKARA
jgi:hypothetical protein